MLVSQMAGADMQECWSVTQLGYVERNVGRSNSGVGREVCCSVEQLR